jgi:hypothetical protein
MGPPGGGRYVECMFADELEPCSLEAAMWSGKRMGALRADDAKDVDSSSARTAADTIQGANSS